MKIDGHTVGEDGPYVIAEIGINHNGDIDMAKELIDAAVTADADAVKFQSFVAEELVTKSAPKAEYQEGSQGKSQREMLEPYELSPADHRELMNYCSDSGITFLSTPFEERSLSLLDRLDISAIKVGSGELTNLPLLAKIAETGRPMIISTGMSTMAEVEEAVDCIREANPAVPYSLLHCVSLYPTPLESANLRAMRTMQEQFDCPVGFSDHTTAVETGGLAVAIGASIVEKHLTLDRSLPGPDHEASLEPDELARATEIVRNAHVAKGRSEKRPVPDEEDTATVARKSIHAAQVIQIGQEISPNDIEITRPLDGLPPSEYDTIIGMEVTEEVKPGEPITEHLLAGGEQDD